MSKAFISILGTNDYLESFHLLDGKLLSKTPSKYVQEDLVEYFCKDWQSDSEVRIFLTEEARNKNWVDDGQIDVQTKERKKNIGLQNRLKNLNYQTTIKDFTIPEGKTEKDLWEIFEIIFETFKDNDEVIIDVTHSFRFLPLLLTVMLNYTRQVKNIKIEGVYYAAFESLGPISVVENWDVSKRKAPIFDLTPLMKLQEWTLATFDYTQNANINSLENLVKNEIKSILSETKKLPQSEILLRKTVSLLKDLSNNIALCRGSEIVNFDFEELTSNLEKLKESEIVIKPFKLLIDTIITKVSKFKNDDINNGLVAAEWALKHNLYQQAITILQEILITEILERNDLNVSNLKYRKIVPSAIRIKSQNIPTCKWEGEAKKNKNITKILLNDALLNDVKKEFEKLSSIRNDVNHSGFLTGQKNYKSIIQKINDIYKKIKEII